MRNLIKNALKDYVLRPALRQVMTSGIIHEAIAEVAAEEEFKDIAQVVMDEATAAVRDVLGNVELPGS